VRVHSLPAPARSPSPELIAEALAVEGRRFRVQHPTAEEAHERSARHLPRGVPLHWMSQWPTDYPVHIAGASGGEVTDVDDNTYVDFCLADSAAMFGHGLADVAEAVRARLLDGAGFMLPTSDAAGAAENLAARFGLPYWQFATSATDANRFAVRLARLLTGRPKLLVFNGKYHGSLDETHVMLVGGQSAPQPGIAFAGEEVPRTTVVVEFNDLRALERALAEDDVACVLAEPAMTNCSMILPGANFHDGLRELTREAGSLLILDETHTFCAGPQGMTGREGLKPDFLTLGKSIGGGIPVAVYGFSEAVAAGVLEHTNRNGFAINHFGFGGTLAGNALATQVVSTVLERHATPANYERMIRFAEKLEGALEAAVRELGVGWSLSRLGCRVELVLAPQAHRDATEARASRHPELEAAVRLGLLNRGFLLTPFHPMALVCPHLTDRHIAAFAQAFTDAVEPLLAPVGQVA
jgi:glutamate-1-semialdehyde 2,1-aminomutase